MNIEENNDLKEDDDVDQVDQEEKAEKGLGANLTSESEQTDEIKEKE